jgi:hypothetical protein
MASSLNLTPSYQVDLSMKSFEFANDHDDRPTVSANVGVLYPATSIEVPVGE